MKKCEDRDKNKKQKKITKKDYKELENEIDEQGKIKIIFLRRIVLIR